MRERKCTVAVLACLLAFCILSCMVAVSGCDGAQNQGDAIPASMTEESAAPEETFQADGAEELGEENVPETTDAGSLVVTEESLGRQLMVYYVGEDTVSIGTLQVKQVQVEDVDKDVIVSELVNAGVLDGEVKANTLLIKQNENGKVFLKVDFNAAFEEQMQNYGSKEESIIMAAVVNTFLQAENANRIKITVEGHALETGHQLYEEAMSLMYED